MNVYIQELKMLIKSTIYWTIGMVCMVGFFTFMYPSVSEDASPMMDILSKFPEQFVKALGLTDLDLTTILGFYGFIFSYIMLIGSIYAMKSSLGILSEEIRSKTADFLMSKPLKRWQIANAKISALVTCILLQNIVYTIIAFFVLKRYGDFDLKAFFLINLSILLVQMFFVGIGLIIAVALKKIKTVLPISLGIVFIFFTLKMLNETLGDEKLSYVTPFDYYNVSEIIKSVNYDIKHLIVNLAALILLTIFTYIIYNKKDISSVS